jgi:hypothetical protein
LRGCAHFEPLSYGDEWFAEDEKVSGDGREKKRGFGSKAHPLVQAERISRSMVDVRVVDGALLLDADPAWAGGAINTVLVKQGVRVSELCRPQKAVSLAGARFQENVSAR